MANEAGQMVKNMTEVGNVSAELATQIIKAIMAYVKNVKELEALMQLEQYVKDGGTMDFENIVEYINENTGDFLINVIITDAQFDINSSKFEKEIKNYNGLMLFITNCENVEVKNLSKKYEQTLKYILASANFELG